MRIIPMNETDAAHLEQVVETMRTAGTPTIKAVWVEGYDAWVALEGSHRLAAAALLGLSPVIEEVEYSEDITLADLGCDDSDDGYDVATICDRAYRRAHLTLSYEEE
ncbi:hypothetical protein [Nitratidesulfovibrio vulgaris]|uniref:hypothetical protein n=1 Tax=Nitratidesulfovibrio vulgaris TaxID=881 RepID=UPI0013DF26D8|nr:hypothetical protein [Nitratidesulfovibrio vulgaris]